MQYVSDLEQYIPGQFTASERRVLLTGQVGQDWEGRVLKQHRHDYTIIQEVQKHQWLPMDRKIKIKVCCDSDDSCDSSDPFADVDSENSNSCQEDEQRDDISEMTQIHQQ